jgi:PAS domain S-box-containing protein
MLRDLRRKKHYIALAVIIITGLTISLISFVIILGIEQQRVRELFERVADERFAAFQREIESDLQVLESVKVYYTIHQANHRSEFHKLVNPLLLRHPSIQALEWIPRITDSQRAIYEARAKEDGFRNFQISNRKNQGVMVRSPRRSEYYPVYFVEPYKGNEIALGFDLASNATRKESLERAGDTGQMVATRRIKLVQETSGQFGFLVFEPIYEKDSRSDTIPERRNNLKGFALGVFRIGDILEKSLTYLMPVNINIYLYEASILDDDHFLYFSQTRSQGEHQLNDQKAAREKGFEYRKSIDVAGQKWLVLYETGPNYIRQNIRPVPWVILAGGLLFTAGLSVYLLVNLRHSEKLSIANEQLRVEALERRQAEEALKKSNVSLAEAQRIAHIGNLEWNIQTNETYWSDELHRIFGTTPKTFIGTYEAFSEMIHPDDRDFVKDAINKALNESAKAVCNHRIVRSDGSVREVHEIFEMISDGTGKTIRMIGTIQDVTERNEIERELQRARDLLLQSEKLASIGRLSAGVAHEVLNPVNIISTELQLLQTMENMPFDSLEELNICMTQISRIVAITENLKQFSRIPEKKITMADINDVIADILTLYETQLKIEGIETEVQYQPDLPKINMDKDKIVQVILNLITNAVAAMEGKEKKVLRITTERETMFRDRDQLKIMIADTGTGIKSEHMSTIFDPFFTTKKQGKGTGLGLSISYGIIQDHGGRIWAENNEWGGATFFIELPIIQDTDNKFS